MIGPRERFRVLHRDGFFCQYCGRRPPEVKLEVDHIEPRSRGGSDDSLNLITACEGCNRGKSAGILLGRPFIQCADCLEWFRRPQDEEIYVFDGGHAWLCPDCWESAKAVAR